VEARESSEVVCSQGRSYDHQCLTALHWAVFILGTQQQNHMRNGSGRCISAEAPAGQPGVSPVQPVALLVGYLTSVGAAAAEGGEGVAGGSGGSRRLEAAGCWRAQQVVGVLSSSKLGALTAMDGVVKSPLAMYRVLGVIANSHAAPKGAPSSAGCCLRQMQRWWLEWWRAGGAEQGPLPRDTLLLMHLTARQGGQAAGRWACL
jgi:hypothetical protein